MPDTWAARGQRAPGMGYYRASFSLAEAPAGAWALQLQRLSTRHRLSVNGQLVQDTLQPDNTVQRRPVPALVGLPPALLRSGENFVEITVDNGQRAGLSALQVGPAGKVESAFLWGYHRSVTIPQLLNVASCGVSLFTLLLWWRRRSEVALGTFSLLGILTSVRNFGYYQPGNSLPLALTDWLYFAAQVTSVVLLGFFATSLTGYRLRGFRPALLVTGGVLLLAGAAAAMTGRLNPARALAYPLLLALTLPSLWLVARRARELRVGPLLALLAGLMAVLASGVHDYLYQQGYTSIMDGYWLPYAVPVALTGFSAVLMQRVVGALSEVEELNQTLELRVRERTRDLQQANAAKTRFIAAASHDLRQPVVTIGLLVGLLREQLPSRQLRGMMDRVNEAVASLEALLKGLLDLSRFDAGTVRPRLQAVAVQALFDAIAAHEGEAARLKGVRLRFRPTQLAVHSDPVLLEQVVRNLVNNAVRYTDHGGVLVGARNRAGSGRVLLQVWDTGRGIPQSQHEAVFEEFAQLGASRDGMRGLGLGLALVKRAAVLLGHTLQLRSVPQRGSCFSLELPLTQALPRLQAPQEVERQPLAGLGIVLVEDEPAVRDAMTLQLERWGAQVEAFDGLPALEQALQAHSGGGTKPPWGLLVSDNRLPGADSLRVIDEVRRSCGPLPVLVVTGDTAPRDLAALTASGVPVLHKPFRAAELLAAIEGARAGDRRT